MSTVLELMGWVGAFGLLLAFYLNSTNRLTSNTLKYQWLNLISAVLLAINAFWIESIPFVIINVFWAVIAVSTIWRIR